MFWILLSILCNVYIMIFFRKYAQQQKHVLPVLVWNYFFASLAGWSIFYICQNRPVMEASLLRNASWMGVLFLGVFYLISLTTSRFGMGIASLANKSGYILPVMFSVLYYRDSVSLYQLWALMAGVIFLGMVFWENPDEGLRRYLWLPVLVILGSGAIDTLMLWNSRSFFIRSTNAGILSSAIFLSAFISGMFILFIKNVRNKWFHLHAIRNGFLLGIPNFFSIWSLLKAVESQEQSKGVVFGLVNIGIVCMSVLCGRLLFSEKLKKRQRIGVIGLLLCMLMMIL